MDWNTAFKYLQNDKKIRRTDTGFDDNYYIFLDICNGNRYIYIKGANSYSLDVVEMYGVSYSDLISTNWVII